MTKSTLFVTATLAIGLAAAKPSLAQQAPASGAQTTAPAKPGAAAKPAGSAQGTAGAKPGTATGAKRPATAAAPLKTNKEKASYAIGMNIGNGLKKDDVDVDTASLVRGIRDAFAGTKSVVSDEDAKTALTAFATEVRAKQQAKLEAIAAVNKKTGEQFLAANKTKEGVITLPDGLQYKVLTAGTGGKVAATDQVVCNYRGTLLDGTEFDSSYKRGEPVTFGLSQVIKGWNEALQLMPVGSKWQLYVPAELAYGNEPRGQVIPPGSTLIFDIELISIAPKAEAAKTEAPKSDAPKVSETPKADAPKSDTPKPKPPQ